MVAVLAGARSKLLLSDMSESDSNLNSRRGSEPDDDHWLDKLTDVQRFELNLLNNSIDLSDVDTIQWFDWKTATGTAALFPDLLRRASTARGWQTPLEQILYGCCCVNELHSAAVPTYQFLIRILAIEPTKRQAFVLEEIANWIWCANWSDFCLDGHSTEFLTRRSIANHRDIFQLMLASGAPTVQSRAVKVLKLIDEQLATCPACGQKLTSIQAKQCFHCGQNWR